jgi:hypothetical protein
MPAPSVERGRTARAVRRRRGLVRPGHRIVGVVTEIGFVSLLVAGFGALAGGLVYLAVRVARGRW